MKFLPESKKKTVILSVVIIIFIAATIYVNFFYGKQDSSQPTTTSQDLSTFEGGLLPHGSKINMKILNDRKFTSLRPTPKVEVHPGELGKIDLFGLK